MKTLLLLFLYFVAFVFTIAAQATVRHGVDLFRNGDYQGAVKELEAVKDPGELTGQHYLYLGAAYIHIGETAKAQTAFQRAHEFTGKPVALDGDAKLELTKRPRPDFGDAYPRDNSVLVTLVIELLPDGKIGFVFRLGARSSEMFSIAEKWARKIKFKPGTSNGRPVTMVRLLEYVNCEK